MAAPCKLQAASCKLQAASCKLQAKSGCARPQTQQLFSAHVYCRLLLQVKPARFNTTRFLLAA
jgi:hypothetical protein